MNQNRRIGFISTRFAGTDGVSLETAKWAAVLARMGHLCFYFCGQCDRPPQVSEVVAEAFFGHPDIAAINQAVYGGGQGAAQPLGGPRGADFYAFTRPPGVSRRVHELKETLKQGLYRFARRFELNLLIVENALTIPINLPLGLAISEFIAETGIPTVAHHHDFYWERQRFARNAAQDYLNAAFPPNLPSIRHVVINSAQARQIASRVGVYAVVIPNVMDYDDPPPAPDEYASLARADLGAAPGELLILQPTRIIQRKGIEHAIELTRRLGLPARLVISHAAGDEGLAYELRLREFAALLGVDVQFKAEIVGPERGLTPDGRRIYTLGDAYSQADLVTYPSLIEGFGNAFLEAVYYRRPVVVNNYPIYESDIKPKGFGVVEFDGYIGADTLEQVRSLLAHPEETRQMCAQNYEIARQHFSYAVLERQLNRVLAGLSEP